MNTKKIVKYTDWWLIGAVCILSIFGIICIGSATHINLGESPSTYYTQMVWFTVGLVIMFCIMLMSIDFISKFYIPLYFCALLLLVAVLLFGRTVNGATRWIYFGPVGIQPSEFTKLIMIICLANLIDKNRDRVNNISIIVLSAVLIFIPIILIQKQPSLSASLVLVAIYAVVMFVAGLDYKYISVVAAIAIPAIFFILWDVQNADPIFADIIFKPHQINRLISFVNPVEGSDAYYQTMKSINAIGSGQLTGKGLYEGTLNQLSYLPEPQNDFIFSVIGEEFGFIGCIAVLLLEFFIVFRCILIAMNCQKNVHCLMVAGVAGMLAFQTFVNTGVATGILPNTGMSLPFVSYGGSSTWTNMASIGLVLNIGLKRSKTIFEGV
ncbi:MAG: rod shape-determining protein RodA [Firmicutes bacterium]|nr:rod shape-determining protein RodA [Bacillota bacterium]